MAKQFTHLHLHTEYSVLDAMVKVPDLVEKAKSLGMTSIAITDHGNMSGLLSFYSECKNNGIKPIIGIEAYIVKNMHQKQRVQGEREKRYHITLLAKNNEGYKNLVKLTTESYIHGFYYKPRIDEKLLAQHSNGLICLSGCLAGELPSILKNQDLSEDEKIELMDRYMDRYKRMFGDDFYIEIMHHDFPLEKRVFNALYRYAQKRGYKAVFTNDVHYLNKEDKIAHHALINSSAQSKNMARERSYDGDGYWFKSLEEIKKMGIPNELIDMTQEIANKCNIELDLGKMPKLKITQPNAYKYIADECLKELKKRNLLNKTYVNRVYTELKVIKDLDFGNYFIVVQDFIKWAKSKDIPVGPGRGSACGSLIVWLLGITEVDPIRFGTKFSRFLNYSRKEFPDIDVDFSKLRRGEVIEYITETHGDDYCAQIATFGKLKPKSALKAVARSIGIDHEVANSITKVVNADEFMPDPKIEGSDEMFKKFELKYPELFKQARTLQGFNQNEGKHACGIVICEEKLNEFAPLKRGKDGGRMLQWDLDSLGLQNYLIKFDILGLKNLDTIHGTVKAVKEKYGVDIDWDKIDLDDPKVFNMIRKGHTTGVFQLEGYGMRKLAESLRISKFKELTALLALYRPGPLASGLTQMYVENKFASGHTKFFDEKDGLSKEKIRKFIPKIKDILRNTYGVIVFQEDVMNIAMELAGMSEVETDNLRRATAKKKEKLMNQVKPKFIDGCIENGVDSEVAHKLWDKIVEFAGYSFNMAHALSYALISFRTAWLKCHYPAEYMVNLLNQEFHTDVKQPRLKAEARRLGVPIVSAHVNKSQAKFAFHEPNENEKSRFPNGYIVTGLSFLKNIGENAAEIVAMHAPYKSYDDFITRMDGKAVNSRVVGALDENECFNGLPRTVRRSLWQ